MKVIISQYVWWFSGRVHIASKLMTMDYGDLGGLNEYMSDKPACERTENIFQQHRGIPALLSH
jgi:hypothetical protein